MHTGETARKKRRPVDDSQMRKKQREAGSEVTSSVKRGEATVCPVLLLSFFFPFFLSFFPPFFLKYLARDGSFKRDLLNPSASRLLQRARGHDLIESGHGARARASNAGQLVSSTSAPPLPFAYRSLGGREGATRAHFYSGKKGHRSVSWGALPFSLSLSLSLSCSLTLLLR